MKISSYVCLIINQTIKTMYKIRFHLGAGKNFMKWQVKSPDGTVKFYVPDEVEIRMFTCKLKNRKNGAKKIFDGAGKFVVAWVDAEDVIVSDSSSYEKCEMPSECEDFARVSYNPKVAPNWVFLSEDADGMELTAVISEGRSLYAMIEPNEDN